MTIKMKMNIKINNNMVNNLHNLKNLWKKNWKNNFMTNGERKTLRFTKVKLKNNKNLRHKLLNEIWQLSRRKKKRNKKNKVKDLMARRLLLRNQFNHLQKSKQKKMSEKFHKMTWKFWCLTWMKMEIWILLKQIML